jgi:hypothetical protein
VVCGLRGVRLALTSAGPFVPGGADNTLLAGLLFPCGGVCADLLNGILRAFVMFAHAFPFRTSGSACRDIPRIAELASPLFPLTGPIPTHFPANYHIYPCFSLRMGQFRLPGTGLVASRGARSFLCSAFCGPTKSYGGLPSARLAHIWLTLGSAFIGLGPPHAACSPIHTPDLHTVFTSGAHACVACWSGDCTDFCRPVYLRRLIIG